MAYLVKKLTLVRQSRLDATNCMKQHRGGPNMAYLLEKVTLVLYVGRG